MDLRNCGYCSHCAVGDYERCTNKKTDMDFDYITKDKSTIVAQRRRIQNLEAELLEQARLNGIGSEREARLMAIVEEQKRELASKQAQIDALMLEYYPENMTDVQVQEWERHQVSVVEQEPYCLECGSESLIYLEEYSNGVEYKCGDCGTVRIW